MNYYQSVDVTIRPATHPYKRRFNATPATAKPFKRKFNLMLGLKRCFNDFNEYMGIETTGDKIFYHAYLWFNISVLIMCIYLRIQLANM